MTKIDEAYLEECLSVAKTISHGYMITDLIAEIRHQRNELENWKRIARSKSNELVMRGEDDDR